MLTDQQLGTLLTYLKYFGSVPFQTNVKPGSLFMNPSKYPLFKYGFMTGALATPESIAPAGSVGGMCPVFLQVTDAGQEYVERLGMEDPVRLARLYMNLFYLTDAANYIAKLSLSELPEFLTCDISTMREAALERHNELRELNR